MRPLILSFTNSGNLEASLARIFIKIIREDVRRIFNSANRKLAPKHVYDLHGKVTA